MFKACDFRLNHKAPDRSGRVALCEDRRLSLQHVGQDVPALMLDADECKPLERGELIDILVTLSAFYQPNVAQPTRSQRPVLHMIEQVSGQRRAEVVQKLGEVALALGRLSV